MLDRRTIGAEFLTLQDKLEAKRVRHVPVWLDVYHRGPGDHAAVDHSRLLDEVLMDPGGGFPRVLKSLSHEGDFDEAAADAVGMEIRLSAHEAQLAPLLDREHKIVTVLSGARQGKTHMMAIRCLLGILELGGPGVNIGWLAPSRKQTRIAIEKLVIGKDMPPLIPRALITYYPKKVGSPDQFIELIDGTRVWLNHGSGHGDNLRGEEMDLYLLDEITAVRDEQNFDHALDRTSRTGGQVFVASTPIQNHWARQRLVMADNDEIANYTFTAEDNVWFPLKEIDVWIKAKGGKPGRPVEEQPPFVQREIFGVWTVDGAAAFPCWDPGLHVRAEPHWSVKDWGYQDITRQAALGHWRCNGKIFLVGGQDFNERGHTTVICQVGLKHGGDPGDWKDWVIFALAEISTEGYIEDHAVELQRFLTTNFQSGPIPLAIDATSAERVHESHTGETGRHISGAGILLDHGFEAKAPVYRRSKATGKSLPFNPSQADSLNLLNWLFRRGSLLVHERCEVLRRGLGELERNAKGGIYKVSAPGSTTDILSDPVDALRYPIWALLGERWLRDIRDWRPDTPERQ